MRPDAPFCGQCYADFRPAPAPAPAQVVTAPATAAYGAPAADPLTQPLLDFLPPAAPVEPAAAPAVPAPAAAASEPTWPCTRCASPNPFAAVACGVCGTPFLAQVSADSKVNLVLPLVGDLGAMSRGRRVGLGLGAVALVCVPVALLTLVLTSRPPETGTVVDVPETSVSQETPTGP